MRDVTDASFERDVLGAEQPVVVDFWAPWCRPCHALEPVLADLERAYGERVRFVRVNADAELQTAGRFEILALPTVVLFVDGRERRRISGVRPRDEYDRALREVIPAAELDGTAAE